MFLNFGAPSILMHFTAWRRLVFCDAWDDFEGLGGDEGWDISSSSLELPRLYHHFLSPHRKFKNAMFGASSSFATPRLRLKYDMTYVNGAMAKPKRTKLSTTASMLVAQLEKRVAGSNVADRWIAQSKFDRSF